jgi:hypothetical protein
VIVATSGASHLQVGFGLFYFILIQYEKGLALRLLIQYEKGLALSKIVLGELYSFLKHMASRTVLGELSE